MIVTVISVGPIQQSRHVELRTEEKVDFQVFENGDLIIKHASGEVLGSFKSEVWNYIMRHEPIKPVDYQSAPRHYNDIDSTAILPRIH